VESNNKKPQKATRAAHSRNSIAFQLANLKFTGTAYAFNHVCTFFKIQIKSRRYKTRSFLQKFTFCHSKTKQPGGEKVAVKFNSLEPVEFGVFLPLARVAAIGGEQFVEFLHIDRVP
jgi:hypothetical protein